MKIDKLVKLALVDLERILLEAREDQARRVELLDIFNSGLLVNCGKLKVKAIDMILAIMRGSSNNSRGKQKWGH